MAERPVGPGGDRAGSVPRRGRGRGRACRSSWSGRRRAHSHTDKSRSCWPRCPTSSCQSTTCCRSWTA